MGKLFATMRLQGTERKKIRYKKMISNAIIIIKNDEYYDDTQLLVRSFFRGINVTKESVRIAKKTDVKENPLSLSEGVFFLSNTDMVEKPDTIVINTDCFIPDPYRIDSSRGELHDIYKKGLYKALVRLTDRKLPWGYLTGVRPAKRAMELIKNSSGSISEEKVVSEFSQRYMVSEKKARLAFNVAKNETNVLNRYGISFESDRYQGFSVYVGIPFCPTTCLYCSFPSMPVSKCDKKVIDDYINALCHEIKESSNIYIESLNKRGIAAFGLKPSSVYIGGGTPTALSADELGGIIDCLKESFVIDETIEFCVEAGRPDSITEDKLAMLKDKGINRISVNPQSMNQKTLDLIGRSHTVEDVYISFELARKYGFDNINTDIILGLPGEGSYEVNVTLQALEMLAPDSLTVHSLALKRASRLNINSEDYKHVMSESSEDLIDLTHRLANNLGMIPYYMYRQQNMTGNLENTGYAKKGKESLYNILIMEEVQDILALGAGASSKFMMGNNRFERAINVKDVVNYIRRTDEMCLRKKELLKKN